MPHVKHPLSILYGKSYIISMSDVTMSDTFLKAELSYCSCSMFLNAISNMNVYVHHYGNKSMLYLWRPACSFCEDLTSLIYSISLVQCRDNDM